MQHHTHSHTYHKHTHTIHHTNTQTTQYTHIPHTHPHTGHTHTTHSTSGKRRSAGWGGLDRAVPDEGSPNPLLVPRATLQGLGLGLGMEAEPPLYPVAGAAGPQGDEDRLGVPDGPEAPVSREGSAMERRADCLSGTPGRERDPRKGT